VSLSYRNKYYY